MDRFVKIGEYVISTDKITGFRIKNKLRKADGKCEIIVYYDSQSIKSIAHVVDNHQEAEEFVARLVNYSSQKTLDALPF